MSGSRPNDQSRELGLDANGPMTVEGVTATFEEMRAGIEEGKRLIGSATGALVTSRFKKRGRLLPI